MLGGVGEEAQALHEVPADTPVGSLPPGSWLPLRPSLTPPSSWGSLQPHTGGSLGPHSALAGMGGDGPQHFLWCAASAERLWATGPLPGWAACCLSSARDGGPWGPLCHAASALLASLAPSVGPTRHQEHPGLTTRLFLGSQAPTWSPSPAHLADTPCLCDTSCPGCAAVRSRRRRERRVHSILAKRKSLQMLLTVSMCLSYQQDGSRVKKRCTPLTEHPSRSVQRVLCRRAGRALEGCLDGAVPPAPLQPGRPGSSTPPWDGPPRPGSTESAAAP